MVFFEEVKSSNGHGSLAHRIAAALSDEKADRASLVALCEETEVEIVLAPKVIETETERALDLSNSDPDSSDLAATKARGHFVRLTKAIPELTAKIAAIEAVEYAKAWDAEYQTLLNEEIQLAADLAQLYPALLTKLIGVFAKIDYHKARGNILNRRAPRGEDRRIQDAELAARNIGHYDAMHPPLREKLKLPNWDVSRDIAFPADPMEQINRTVALNNAALVHALELKSAGQFGPDWWQANKLQDQGMMKSRRCDKRNPGINFTNRCLTQIGDAVSV